jgi:hypothetical protein
MHCTERFRAGLAFVALGVAACTGCADNDAAPSATCVNPGGLSHQTSFQRIAVVDRPAAAPNKLTAPFEESDWNSVILRTAYPASADASADGGPRARLTQTRPIVLPDVAFGSTSASGNAPAAPPPDVVSGVVRLPPISEPVPAPPAPAVPAPAKQAVTDDGNIFSRPPVHCPQSVLNKPSSIGVCPPDPAVVVPQAKLVRVVAEPPAVATTQPKPAAATVTAVPVTPPQLASTTPAKPAAAPTPAANIQPPTAAITPAKPVAISEPLVARAQPPVASIVLAKPAPVAETAAPDARPHATLMPVKVAVEPTPIKRPEQKDSAEARSRSAQLDALMQHADAINRHAFALAQRGAIYSARAELMRSLHLLAAGIDGEEGGTRHQQMLAYGLRALEESDDFVTQDPLAIDQLDVARVVAGHQTIVLKDEPNDVSPQVALGRYLTYSQKQIAGAVGNLPPGSAALYGLGKIYSLPATAHGPSDVTGGAKAVVYFQASLQVEPRNYFAANELGVLLVQFGRLPEARAAFRHSLSIVSQPVIWQNLAAVHERLGEKELAANARQSATVVAQRTGGAAPSPYDVQWVDQSTFASSMPINVDSTKGVANTPTQVAEPKRTADASAGWSVFKR